MKNNINFRLNIKKFQPGYTLVELIIYMALLSMFLLILTNVFVAILRVRVESQASSSVDQDGRFILARIAYDINRASSAVVSNPESLDLTIDAQPYIYIINADRLQLTQPSGTDILNSSGTMISDLTFQRIFNPGSTQDTIKIHFTLKSIVQRGTSNESRTFETTIGRRYR